MYGEGYDYAPQYTAMSGNIAGSLPVGMQTSRNKDVSYWLFNNCYNYKEVWVQPSARWLWLISEFSGAARVYGKSRNGSGLIEFVNTSSGKVYNTAADPVTGHCHITLPEGYYKVRYGGSEKDITLLPGEAYSLDLQEMYSVRLISKTISGSKVSVKLEVRGDCGVKLDIRTKNIVVKDKGIFVDVSGGRACFIELDGEVINKNEISVMLVVPNGSMNDKVEIIV